MQNNTITVGTLAYDRFKETPDKTTYVSDNHTVSKPDIMLLGRTIANSDSANAKSRVNFVRDIERVDPPAGTAATTGRVYFNVECSHPQWATDTQLQNIRETVNAFLSSAEFVALQQKQSI